MLKESLFACLTCILIVACNGKSGSDKDSDILGHPDNPIEKNMTVFPVTEYILGELATIENSPVTALETTEVEGHIDSNWVAREDVKELAKPFLDYPIDSAVLYAHYDGQSFMDQTINMVTFTYTREAAAPADLFREIIVYVSPDNNQVQRVYLIQDKGNETRQLTWKGGEWFSIRSLEQTEVKEKKVTWKFR